jgi:voltage-gated potassium channel
MDRKVRPAIAFFAMVLLTGMVGYHFIEGWPYLDALYMTIITVSTVGFREVEPLSPAGKLFTAFLIVTGVGTLAYTGARVVEAIFERGLLGERRMRVEIKRLSDHVILCGYGRMGREVGEQLEARGIGYVVVEKDPEILKQLQAEGIRFVGGDATDEKTLTAAGVEKARAMATVLPHDADNLFVTLTARGLNRNMAIVTRSSHRKNDPKMIAAGATRVLNVYLNSGRLMARQLLHPSVTAFMDMISQWGDESLGLEEVQLMRESPLVGVELRNAPLRSRLNVIVVGVRGKDAVMRFNPPSEYAPSEGDVLVVLGHRENLRQLERMAEGG